MAACELEVAASPASIEAKASDPKPMPPRCKKSRRLVAIEGPGHFAGDFLLDIAEVPGWIKHKDYRYLTGFWQRIKFGRLTLAE
tara:strand:- start:473 stop:724 length:252 start_codon:yes stop_codon:yes gene_type:complete